MLIFIVSNIQFNHYMKKINNKYLIEHIYERVLLSKNKLIILTTTNISDDSVYNFCKDKNIICYRGCENDVLERYYQCNKLVCSDIIVRLTCDCPYLDIEMLNDMINYFKNNNLDYLYNTDELDINNIYPEGSDIEIINNKTLKYLYETEKIREHATGCIRLKREYYSSILKMECFKNSFNKLNLVNNFNGIHLSIDTENDLELADFIFKGIGKYDCIFNYEEILKFLDKNYNEYQLIIKKKIIKKTGQELYKLAKTLIPGGTQLLSKRPEMFLPDNWPSYYSKVEGITVTDLDGNKFIDMSINGVGSCILGANDQDVNREVIKCIQRGNMSTLNHPNEVYLTQKLIELHPWAEMARYTRSSGEACSVAIRIARAYSGRSKIAFCGYHGWHDWYLAANINSNGLDKHLLSGLSSVGVPNELGGTILPFTYNKYNELEDLINNNEIGVIIMEPMRNVYPEDGFLENIRKLATEKNIPLIFDEVSSGFRVNCGGMHMTFGVEPDIAIFGKALSNGYPLGAIIGRKSIMQKAQETFISSTYWTEGIGFTAGLATIIKYQTLNVGDHNKKVGIYFQNKMIEVSKKHNIKINVSGHPGITGFSFDYTNPLEIKTLFVQEMLKYGYLATTGFYVNYCHNEEVVDKYFEKVEEFFIKWGDNIRKENIFPFLKGPLCHGGFKRLN
jgi:glutamate-1-semialdehyde 2,1-aminomutase